MLAVGAVGAAGTVEVGQPVGPMAPDIKELTGGLEAHSVIEAVGTQESTITVNIHQARTPGD